jgi:hypothetical protein
LLTGKAVRESSVCHPPPAPPPPPQPAGGPLRRRLAVSLWLCCAVLCCAAIPEIFTKGSKASLPFPPYIHSPDQSHPVIRPSIPEPSDPPLQSSPPSSSITVTSMSCLPAAPFPLVKRERKATTMGFGTSSHNSHLATPNSHLCLSLASLPPRRVGSDSPSPVLTTRQNSATATGPRTTPIRGTQVRSPSSPPPPPPPTVNHPIIPLNSPPSAEKHTDFNQVTAAATEPAVHLHAISLPPPVSPPLLPSARRMTIFSFAVFQFSIIFAPLPPGRPSVIAAPPAQRLTAARDTQSNAGLLRLTSILFPADSHQVPEPLALALVCKYCTVP